MFPVGRVCFEKKILKNLTYERCTDYKTMKNPDLNHPYRWHFFKEKKTRRQNEERPILLMPPTGERTRARLFLFRPPPSGQ